MDSLSSLVSWISSNESLLSGTAALIVVAGVILSPLGLGVRRLLGSQTSGELERSRDQTSPRDPIGVPPSAIASQGGGEGRVPASPRRITLKDLTAPALFETRFARSDGVRIAYNVRGSGPPDVIVAPGIISHLNILEHLPSTNQSMEGLARFARVLSFDKRGQGLSDPTLRSPNLEERTRDIGAVMDAAGMERAILLGVSEGGPMCLHFAHTHPERVQGLVLLGSTARFTQSEDFPIGLPQSALESLPGAWGKGVLRRLFFPSVSLEQMDDATYRAMERLIGSPEAIQQVVEMMVETDVRPLLPEIRVPTLVVHFAGDLAVPIRLGRYLAENIPGAEFMEVNAVDHGDLSQSPEALARVKRFCLEVEA